MLPGGTQELPLSQMNFFGAGATIIRKLMKDHQVASLEEFVEMARDFGVRMVACDMSRELLGIHDEELIDGLEFGGVAAFMGDAARSKVSLFI
jgi:peroxiredoxin family protein